MGEPVSLKIRSDLYCNSNPGLPASLPSSFTSPVSTALPAPLLSPQCSTVFASSQQSILPPPPAAHKPITTSCLPPVNNTNNHPVFSLQVPTPHRTAFPAPAQTGKFSYVSPGVSHLPLPVSSCEQPTQQGALENNYYNSKINSTNIGSAGIGNSSTPLSQNPGGLPVQSYNYRQSQQDSSLDYNCYNFNTPIKPINPNENISHQIIRNNFSNPPEQEQRRNFNTPAAFGQTGSDSTCLPPALIHSKSLAGGRPVNMPPVEALQIPKESLYNPSTPPMNISSSVIPNKRSSANIETNLQSNSSTSYKSPNRYQVPSTLNEVSSNSLELSQSIDHMMSPGSLQQQQHESIQQSIIQNNSDKSSLEGDSFAFKSVTNKESTSSVLRDGANYRDITDKSLFTPTTTLSNCSQSSDMKRDWAHAKSPTTSTTGFQQNVSNFRLSEASFNLMKLTIERHINFNLFNMYSLYFIYNM